MNEAMSDRHSDGDDEGVKTAARMALCSLAGGWRRRQAQAAGSGVGPRERLQGHKAPLPAARRLIAALGLASPNLHPPLARAKAKDAR